MLNHVPSQCLAHFIGETVNMKWLMEGAAWQKSQVKCFPYVQSAGKGVDSNNVHMYKVRKILFISHS